MQPRRWPRALFFAVLALSLLADQSAKAWALHLLRPVEMIPVIPGLLNFTFVRNTGIAFGLFAGHGWIVALAMLALTGAAIAYSSTLDWRPWIPNVLGGCLVGGAIGNLLDRSRLGFVVDFIDVHLGLYHWPVFNIADSLICVSVFSIVLLQLRAR